MFELCINVFKFLCFIEFFVIAVEGLEISIMHFLIFFSRSVCLVSSSDRIIKNPCPSRLFLPTIPRRTPTPTLAPSDAILLLIVFANQTQYLPLSLLIRTSFWSRIKIVLFASPSHWSPIYVPIFLSFAPNHNNPFLRLYSILW